MEIEVVPFSGNVKYLGSMLTFDEPLQSEIDHRISMGWKKFMSLKEELVTKKYSLRNRMRLFNSTVMPTVLYGSAIWALTSDLEKKLVRTQRRMLRMVLGHGRRQDDEGALESWVDWVRRTTHEAEEILQSFGVETWDVTVKRRKWRWARRIGSSDMDAWAFLAATWAPEFEPKSCRHQGRPKIRWADDISQFLISLGHVGEWWQLAADQDLWEDLEDLYVKKEAAS